MESTVPKNMRDGQLRLYSGAQEYIVAYEQGNLQTSIPGPTVALYLDRGKITDPPAVRYDQDQPCSGSFTAYLRELGSSTYMTAAQFITKSAYYLTNWASTLGANAEVPTLNLEWTVAGVTHGDTADRVVLWPYTYLSGNIAEGSPSQLTLNFTSYVLYPTVS